MAEVHVIGANRLKRTMRQAGISMKTFKDINIAAAGVVSAAAIAAAPVGTGRKGKRGRRRAPGRLKASIRVSGTQKAGIVRAGGARVPYAGVVHYGWRKRNIKGKPFIANAAKATEPKWTKMYEKRIDEILDQIKGA